MRELEPGRLLAGRCELIDVLGRGRGGVVMRAYDHILGRVVGAKLFETDERTSLDTITARAREQRQRFEHPNLVTTLDAFHDGPIAVVLVELFDLGDLEHIGTTRPDLTAAWATTVLGQTLAGLQALHERGRVHGDLHGGNLLASRADAEGLRFAIADFGAMGTSARARGNLGIVAPELLGGAAPDVRSDLYALGCTVQACCPGSLDAAAQSLLARLTEADPAARPANADDALGILQSFGPPGPNAPVPSDLGIAPLPEGWAPLEGERRRRRETVPALQHPFVGRTTELRRLERVWRTVGEGGASVCIIGEAGAGKTTLLFELMRQVTPAAVIHARAEPGGLPLTLWRNVVHAIVDLLGVSALTARLGLHTTTLATLDHRLARESRESSSDERTAALIALLREVARDTTTALVLDDLHWADPLDLEILTTVGRGLVDASLMLIGASRPAEHLPSDFWPIDAVVELAPLPADDIMRLAASLNVDADTTQLSSLARRSGGNAYLAVEFAQALAENPDAPIPDSIATALRARLDEVGPDATALLEVLAVAERETPVAALSAALGQPPDRIGRSIADAADARLVRYSDSSGTTLDFAHDLTRETLTAQLDPDRRKDLHRHLGAALRGVAADDAQTLLRAARHLAAGGERGEALAVAIEARELVRRGGDPELELAAGTAALELADGEELVAMAAEVGALAERLGHLDHAIAALERGMGAGDDPLRKADLQRARGYTLEKSGDYEPSIAAYDAADAVLDEHFPGDTTSEPVQRLRAQIALGTAVTHFYRSQCDESRMRSLVGLRIAEQLGAERLVAQACLQLEMVSSELGLPDRAEWGDRAVELLERSGDPVALGNLLLNLGVSTFHEGASLEALTFYRRATEAFHEAHDVVGAAIARNNEAEILTSQGRFRDAQWRLADALDDFVSTGYRMGEALATSGLSRVMLHTGRVQDAERLLRRALSLFEELDAVNFVYDTLVRQMELCLFEEDCDGARAADATAAALEERLGSIAVVPITRHRLRGLVDWRGGDDEGATLCLRTAEQMARQSHARSELSLVLHALVTTGLDDRDAIRQELTSVNEELGVVWLPTLTPG